MLSKVLALLLIVQTVQVFSNIISVKNGGQNGYWADWVRCPNGSYATGFSLRVEPYNPNEDNAAVTGVKLYCTKPRPPHDETPITSGYAQWGNWTEAKWCKYGILSKFALQVEKDQGRETDDTAVNNIKFGCTDGGELEGDGLFLGTYGSWSESCKLGICGLQTKIQGDDSCRRKTRHITDDTGLNDLCMECCDK